jgi:hypothetical protein
VMAEQRKVVKGSFVNMLVIAFNAVNAWPHCLRFDGYEYIVIPAIRVRFRNNL